MARLFEFDYSSSDEGIKKQNFEVREREGRRYIVWSEDLDIVIIEKDELNILANALGYKLVEA